MNDPRGSDWRKWDLHIHSPASIIQHYGSHQAEETWEKFISDLEALSSEFKVIGINDYCFIDGYRKVCDYKNKGRLKNIDLILPVIELRIDNFVGTSEWRRINFHVVFSNELSADEIQAQFLSGIQSHYQLSPEFADTVKDWDGIHTRESLVELGKAIQQTVPESEKNKFDNHLDVGFNNLNCSLEKIKDLLKKQRFKNKHITAIGKAEWENMRWTPQSIAAKKNLINGVDVVFTASPTIEAYNKGKHVLSSNSVNSRLLHCSDAHYLSSNIKTIERIGHCFTWIKANPTFKGLKHAITEFEDRVFVGNTPPKIELVRANSRKFIESVTIEKIENSKLTTKWFQDVGIIPFNSGLVSIIGNKGSGKSGLTDILGLLGNSKNQQHFSFLEANRFRNKKDKLAENFIAKIKWADGHEIQRKLNEIIDDTEPELVRYIPQKFFESICNDIAKEDNQFERELHQVIFSHISVVDRHDQTSLKDLIKYKTIELKDSLNLIKNEISGFNTEIWEIEQKLRPEYRKTIENQKIEKFKELEAYSKTKPVQIKKPENKSDTTLSNAVEAKNLQINNLLDKEKEIRKALKEKSDLSAKYEHALKQIENFESRVSTARTAFDNLELPVYFSDIVTIKIDKSKLELKAAESTQEKNKLFVNLEEIPILRGNLNKELADLIEKLNLPQKEYQEYERKLAEWYAKESEIIGDESKIDSLKYFENLIESLIGLPIRLKILKEDRRKRSIEIFNKIFELRDIYKTLYKAVQDFIENDELANKFDLEFDVSIIERSFAEKFLSFIRQNIAGKFFHSGSTGFVDELVEKFNFNEIGDVTAFLNEIESLLEGENIEEIAKGQATDLYNYTFSLEYLKPTYQLKLFGKGIEQLSPGERGHLLLVFYLLVDKDDRPLIIDQPEGNLDGQSIFETLVSAIKRAKKSRQIIIVTHNPNLAVVCDSEQFIHAFIDRKDDHAVKYSSGALEESDVKKVVIDKLEGTPPAFDNRKSKYSFGVQN